MRHRSFSLLLARRHLNPRRSMLSWFSLISFTGVMLGVTVLVVVMAVYAGMERDLKSRLLGFVPHILVRQLADGQSQPSMPDWKSVAEQTRKLPGVEAATAYITDNVVIDRENFQRPVQFYAIDATDPAQVKGLDAMLAKDQYPLSSADMGLDDRVVVSTTLADHLGLAVGDKVRLYSTRNLGSVMEAYKSTERGPLREAFAQVWTQAVKALEGSWKKEDGQWVVPGKVLRDEVYAPLSRLFDENIRDHEKKLLSVLLEDIKQSDKDEAADVYRFTPDAKGKIGGDIAAINSTDVEKMDAGLFKDIKKFVLPREVTVIGVYQSSMMAPTPDMFVPLPLGQDLAGLEGPVQGVSLRLADPYKADEISALARRTLSPQWAFITWGQQLEMVKRLLNQQRVMMYFALSVILLVSAFSMMAVMFTVTIQKRREIGVMKALGAAPGQIVRVFLYQGMLLGVLGGVMGVALGRTIIHYRGPIQGAFRALGFDPYASMLTGFTTLPAYNDPKEQAAFALMGFILCSLAALVPAFFASRSDAAKSLRSL